MSKNVIILMLIAVLVYGGYKLFQVKDKASKLISSKDLIENLGDLKELKQLDKLKDLEKLGIKDGFDNDSGLTDTEKKLIKASGKGDIGDIKELIKAGVNINCKNYYNRTPLFFAADKNHPQVVKFLIENGAKINAQDMHNSTALTLAAEKGYGEVVKILVESGADITAKDNDGDTALNMAVT